MEQLKKTPKEIPGLTFINKNIEVRKGEKNVDLLEEYIKPEFQNIFLKMDIEGHEYRFLNTLEEFHINQIKQLVIEFHTPWRDFFKLDLLKKIEETHYLIHFHPNNSAGIMNIDGVTVPNIFEATYIRKNSIDPAFVEINKRPIPDPSLDQKNSVWRDIHLSGYPYTEHDHKGKLKKPFELKSTRITL